MAANMFDREQFTRKISETELFSSLKPQFVQALGPFIQGLVTSAWDMPEGKPRLEFQSIVKNLVNLQQKLLNIEGVKDIQSIFANFVQSLDRIFKTLSTNPEIASEIRETMTGAIVPMHGFIQEASKRLETEFMPNALKDEFKQRLNWIDKRLQKINNAPLNLTPEKLRDKMGQKLSNGILPLGNALLDTALSPLGLDEQQKNELTNMAKDLMDIPLNLLSGESTLEEAIQNLIKILEQLFKFLLGNPDVILKVASCILPALGPMGVAVAGALQMANVAKEMIPDNLKDSLSELTGQTVGLETLLQSNTLKLDSPKM